MGEDRVYPLGVLRLLTKKAFPLLPYQQVWELMVEEVEELPQSLPWVEMEEDMEYSIGTGIVLLRQWAMGQEVVEHLILCGPGKLSMAVEVVTAMQL